MPSSRLHSSPFAGSWYPGERISLEGLLSEIWEGSELKENGPPLPDPVGFVVPHAGIAYSGQVAAAVYRRLAQQCPRRVFILGFAHRGSPQGAWIPEIDAYRTPMGETPVDREAVGELLASGAFRSMSEERLCDHSVEIQLPLIARAVPDAAVVPVYVSGLTAVERKHAATALAALTGPRTTILASSDFTHYGDAFHYKPFPSDRAAGERIRSLDHVFIDAAGSLEPHVFLETLDAEAATVCGRQPIALLLETLSLLPNSEEIFQTTLDYATSGEMTGDRSHSVSYAALGYYPWQSFLLDADDARCLLESARKTLRSYQDRGERIPLPADGGSPALERAAAAFVTLHSSGQLRGCVGRCVAKEPLSQTVPEMALAAALEDRRFEPLRPDESGITVSVSILSPLKRLACRERLRVGRDGGHLQAGARLGILLPDVAKDRGWTVGEFLEALARKTGVTSDAYDRSDTSLHVFRTQVLH